MDNGPENFPGFSPFEFGPTGDSDDLPTSDPEGSDNADDATDFGGGSPYGPERGATEDGAVDESSTEGDTESISGEKESSAYPEANRQAVFEIGRLSEGQASWFNRPDGSNFNSLIPTLLVRSDASDDTITIIDSNLATMSEDNLSDVIATIKEKVGTLAEGESEEGRLTAYTLRYLAKTDTEGNLIVAFADYSHETSRLAGMLWSTLPIGAIALVALFFISLGLSSLALKPVKASLDQQKQFVADASHELKTPLTVILTNNEIVLRHPDESVSSQKEWLESTQEEGARMKRLIENLLFLAKSDADRVPLTLLKLNLSDLVESCVLTFEPVAFEKGILIDADVTPGIAATVDEAQMKQLLMILLDNACKYSEPKGTIRVRFTRGGSDAVLSVNNRGEVIAPDKLPKLFERFYRTDNARTHNDGDGYGLGLSIAKTISDLHHGSLTVTSTEEDGTTFTYTMKAA